MLVFQQGKHIIPKFKYGESVLHMSINTLQNVYIVIAYICCLNFIKMFEENHFVFSRKKVMNVSVSPTMIVSKIEILCLVSWLLLLLLLHPWDLPHLELYLFAHTNLIPFVRRDE